MYIIKGPTRSYIKNILELFSHQGASVVIDFLILIKVISIILLTGNIISYIRQSRHQLMKKPFYKVYLTIPDIFLLHKSLNTILIIQMIMVMFLTDFPYCKIYQKRQAITRFLIKGMKQQLLIKDFDRLQTLMLMTVEII